jgi:hypothetical protein
LFSFLVLAAVCLRSDRAYLSSALENPSIIPRSIF